VEQGCNWEISEIIPLNNIVIELDNALGVRSARLASSGRELSLENKGDIISLLLPELKIFEIVVIECAVFV